MEPEDLDVKFGSTAYFTCRAEGDPAPDIVWMKDRYVKLSLYFFIAAQVAQAAQPMLVKCAKQFRQL